MPNVIQFPGDDGESDRLRALIARVGLDQAGRLLGSSEDWAFSAASYLKCEMGSKREGGVTVSVAALSLLLNYFEEMAGRLGIIPPPSGQDAA